MNKQREIIVTVTYNDLGIIVDTKAEERKKGKWILHDPCKRGLGKVYECSNCGEMVDCVIYNFCPNCGARMEGNDE